MHAHVLDYVSAGFYFMSGHTTTTATIELLSLTKNWLLCQISRRPSSGT